MSEDSTDLSRESLNAIVEELAKFVGTDRAEEIVFDVVDEVEATSEISGEIDVIRVCQLIEERHSGTVARVASEFRAGREARQQFSNLLTTIPDPICVVTLEQGDLLVREVNEAFAETFGGEDDAMESSEDEEEWLDDALSRYDDDPPINQIVAAVASQQQVRDEIEIRTAAGNQHFLVHVSPFEGHPTSQWGILLFTDITEQKEHAQHLRHLQQISTVLNRILRHNLRNELNVIMGMAETLRRKSEGVDEEIDQLVETTHNLLDLSENAREIERAIQRDSDVQPIDVVDVVETELASIRDVFPNATVEASLPDEALVSADAELSTVFDHLFDNAIRHNDADDRRLVVDLVVEEGTVVVSVVDNGPGIPPEELEAVSSGSETPLRHGSGLGLWLVRWLVEQYDGEVTFDADRDEGTEVTVRLPTV